MRKQKFSFLTSVAVFGVMSAPAIADIANNAESATCNSDTIGVSSGSTILEALWTAQSKNCDAGQYLNASTANCTTCPTGSYCAGGTYTYNGSNLGITDACPTNYNSDEGASAQTDCYRACETTDVAHSTAVSGRYYYGDNNQCSAESCVKGYTASTMSDLANAPVTNSIAGYRAWIDASGNYNANTVGTDMASEFNQNYYGISEPNSWSFAPGAYVARGRARCSSVSGEASDLAEVADETGQVGARYCWCNVTGVRNINDNNWVDLKSNLWGLKSSHPYDSSDKCASSCAKSCVDSIGGKNDSIHEILFNTVSDKAFCVVNSYTCAAGTYLDNSTETCVTCPAGSYCAGGTFTYNGNDQGITGTCSGEYNLSDAGAKSVNDCYRSCATTDIAHSVSVSGKYYYGDVNMCQATNCASGWTAKEGMFLSQYAATSPTNSTGLATSAAGAINASGAYIEEYSQIEHGQNYYGLTENNTWAIDTGEGIVYGIASCNDTTGDAVWSGNISTRPDGAFTQDSTGTNCWCQLTGYKADNTSPMQNAKSVWMLMSIVDGTEYCENYCASWCTNTSYDWRMTMFESASTPSSCEANTITIDWYNLGTLLQTNSCTYGQSDIVIPETPSRTGYTFGGWHVNNAE